MTDNEIIKALECCADGLCDECGFFDEASEQEPCQDVATRNALDLINRLKTKNNQLDETIQQLAEEIKRQKAENESVTKRADMWHREAELNAAELIKMQAEIEDLKKDINHYKINLPYLEHQSEDFCGVPCSFMENLVEKAKAEAIKECLEWVLSLFPEDKNFTTISRFTVNRKLKEMVGESDV